MGGMFGAIRDAAPDHWGRSVIERQLRQANPSELQYLLHSPDDRAGALGFGLNPVPPAPRRVFNRTIDLVQLQRSADAILNDEETHGDADGAQVENLLLVGTSMGGARPKAVVEDKSGLWVAKFNRPDDRWDSAKVEHAMLVLARACGLDVAESRVVEVAGRSVLLVKRFDRLRVEDGYLRARMVSAMTLLRAEDTFHSRERWSYVALAEELRRVCSDPERNAAELFRRMCFNALISNTDDHPRNHAIIARSTDWMLSPAYDLTPTAPVSTERRDLAMICGDQGRFASAANLRSQHARFLLDRVSAQAIVDETSKFVRSTWYPTLRAAGVTERDCALVSRAFVYPGFGATQA
jgi:serine/threonine-protein kinase HipA